MSQLHNYTDRINEAVDIYRNIDTNPGNPNINILGFIGTKNQGSLDFINSNTFELRNVDMVEEYADQMLSENKNLASINEQLIELSEFIKRAWENESGQDIRSSLNRLKQLTTLFNDSLLPVYESYASTMKDLVDKTRTLQNQTIDG